MPTFSPYTHLDLIALAWFAALISVYRLVAGARTMVDHSIVGAVQRQRVHWMRNMAVRDQRIMDSMLLGHLGQGNAFFASTSAIAIGGLAALMGSGDKVQGVLERIPYVAASSPVLWEIKILLLMWIFVYAFFKYAWAYRLSQYAYIMIGATPILEAGNRPACEDHAERTSRLIGVAGEHANAGLRSFYYAIAAMAWFFHPLLFMAAATWVLAILVRRDFFSRSRRIIAGG